jgi:hypothetical protein
MQRSLLSFALFRSLSPETGAETRSAWSEPGQAEHTAHCPLEIETRLLKARHRSPRIAGVAAAARQDPNPDKLKQLEALEAPTLRQLLAMQDRGLGAARAEAAELRAEMQAMQTQSASL